MEMENIVYMDYNDCVQIDMDALIVAAWNRYLEYAGKEENKISCNNKAFFENAFDSTYDAAWAVSTGNWRWTDEFVYVNDEGYLLSFSHLDDESCPIDLDKIDVSHLVDRLNSLEVNKKRYVNNISPVIQDALQEV